ncbi:MAG: hypothetical protein ACI4C1_08160, partial [Lachnospiraceae bacterium]
FSSASFSLQPAQASITVANKIKSLYCFFIFCHPFSIDETYMMLGSKGILTLVSHILSFM